MAISVVDIGRRRHWPSSMLAGRGRRGWWRCRAGNRGRVSTSAIVVAVSVVDIGHLLHRLSLMSAIQQQAHATTQWPSQWGLPRLNGCWGWSDDRIAIAVAVAVAGVVTSALGIVAPPAAFDFCDGHPPPLHSCPPVVVVVVIAVIIPPFNLATTTTS